MMLPRRLVHLLEDEQEVRHFQVTRIVTIFNFVMLAFDVVTYLGGLTSPTPSLVPWLLR